MIIDDVLARRHDPRLYSRTEWDTFVAAARRAERFVFSEKASRMVGSLSDDGVDLIVKHRQFALPPFPTTYMELDARAYFGRRPTTDGEDGKDQRLGYLIDGQRVWLIVEALEASDASKKVLPTTFLHVIGWWLGPESSVPGFVHPIALNFEATGIAAFGSRDAAIGRVALGWKAEALPRKQLEAVGHDVVPLLVGLREYWGRDSGKDAKLLLDTAGDVKHVLACLLWLNQPAHVRLDPRPASARLRGNKRVAYAAHRVVEIDVGEKQVRRIMSRWGHHERASPRRHSVRAHFAHRGGTPGHGHVWSDEPDSRGHWVCGGCGRIRYRRDAYVRGDATRGFVTHEYDVRAADAGSGYDDEAGKGGHP